jgi:hypothetical protein
MSPRLAVLLVLAAGPVACSGSTSATPCTSTSQCPTGQVCVAGVCTVGDGGLQFPDLGDCEAGGARCATTCCTGGQVCRLNQCMAKPPTCTGNKDCQDDTYCQNGECLPWSLNPKGPKNEACQYRSSCTWYENPIVADVNGDFKSELVVPSNANCDIGIACTSNPNHDKDAAGHTLDPLFLGLRCKVGADCLSASCDSGLCRCQTDADCGGGGFVCTAPKSGTPGTGNVCRAAFLGQIGGVFIYHDVLDRWVNSRMIWNQHPYAVTNIGDDGTVPKTSAWKQNWKQPGLNNFRQNVQGALDPTASPDLTAAAQTALPCDSKGMTLKIKLCNRGTKPVGAGIPVTFYVGDPSTKQIACTGQSSVPVSPGDCIEVSCVWAQAPHNNPTDVTAVADDDGAGKGTTKECEEGNNRTLLKGVICSNIQ